MTDRQLPRPDEIQHRAIVAIDYSALQTRAAGDDRIPVALSSETPVDRWYGREILDHSAAAVDLSYARDGFPFLDGHDGSRQVGRIEDIRLDPDRRLRGMLRKGNHPDADWIFRDIETGIRPSLSIGYRIDQLVAESDDEDTYRATRWTPMEGSTVSIPADITVGVGRSAELSNTRGKEPMDTEAQHKPGHGAVTLAEREAEITSIVNLAREHEMTEHVGDWLKRGLTFDRVKTEILNRRRDNPVRPMGVPGHLDMSARDARAFTGGFNAALLAVADRRPDSIPGVVAEVSDEISKRLNRPTPGLYVPLDLPIIHRASVTGNVAGTSSLGGAGIQTTVLPLIDLLRNKMLVRNLGATVLTGLTGNITFPRQVTANTFTWTGENPASPASETAATFDNVTLSPKTGIGRSAYSRQLLVQQSFDASQFVQNDLATVMALGLDLAAIDGTGSNNQPTGVMRQNGVHVIVHTGTAAGGIPTFPEMVGYETIVANSNGDTGSMGWLTTPGVRGKLKTVLKSTVAGAQYIWESDNTINGYPAFATNQVPSGLTYGTSTSLAHGVVFGVWSELLIGEWSGALELVIDPYTYAGQAMIATTGIMMVDVAVRHPGSFAITKSALIA